MAKTKVIVNGSIDVITVGEQGPQGPPGSGAGSIYATRTVTASTTITTDDDIAMADATTGTIVLTLPANSPNGKMYQIKKLDASDNAVIVTPATGTIDGGPAYFLGFQGEAVNLLSYSGAWRIMS